MKVTKFFVALFAVAATMSLTSCFSSEGEAIPNDNTTAGLIEQAKENGGKVTVSNDGASFTVSESQLENSTAADADKWSVAVTPKVTEDETTYVVSLQPEGATFEEPVSVTIPVAGAKDGDVYEVNGKEYTVSGGCITFPVTSFTQYNVVPAGDHSGGSAK